MKKLLTILLTILTLTAFSQVKNLTIHGTKWVRTDSMLIVRGDTVNTVTEGDTLLTVEQWRTLNSVIKSGYDSSRFNVSDGYIYHYISGNVSDSTGLDGRYRPYNDSLFNCAIGEFPITSKAISVNYGSVSFGDSSYHLTTLATYNTTDDGDVIPVQMSIHNLVKTPIGFTCEVDSVIGTFTYLAADSTGLSAYSGGASETDPQYAADSSQLLHWSDTTATTGAGIPSRYDVSLKQDILTNPVTGTGTNNFIPKFTGTSTIGNSVFKDDGTIATLEQNSVQPFTSEAIGAIDNTLYLKAGNVGIGTAVPINPLHVVGYIRADRLIDRNGSSYYCDPDGTGGAYSLLTKESVGIGTTTPTNILSFGGTAARTIWMERNTTAATAGQNLTIQSGGAIAGTADLNAGMFTIATGLSTGTGFSSIRLQRLTRAASTATADNTLTDALIIPSETNLTDNTTKSLFEIALPILTGCGGYLVYTIVVGDGTDVQVHSGTVNYAALNKGGVYTTNIVDEGVTQDANAASSGTLAESWNILEGTNKITIQCTFNSSLTPTSMKMRYTIFNNSGQTITQL